MTLIKPTHHLSSFEWLIIQMLGKYARRILNLDHPTDDLDRDTWQLYRRTAPSQMEIDFHDSFWEWDKAHRQKYADIVLALDNGKLNIPIRTLHINDLLCLKLGNEYVELFRHPDGWAVYTPIDMIGWDHWLASSGEISYDF